MIVSFWVFVTSLPNTTALAVISTTPMRAAVMLPVFSSISAIVQSLVDHVTVELGMQDAVANMVSPARRQVVLE